MSDANDSEASAAAVAAAAALTPPQQQQPQHQQQQQHLAADAKAAVASAVRRDDADALDKLLRRHGHLPTLTASYDDFGRAALSAFPESRLTEISGDQAFQLHFARLASLCAVCRSARCFNLVARRLLGGDGGASATGDAFLDHLEENGDTCLHVAVRSANNCLRSSRPGLRSEQSATEEARALAFLRAIEPDVLLSDAFQAMFSKSNSLQETPLMIADFCLAYELFHWILDADASICRVVYNDGMRRLVEVRLDRLDTDYLMWFTVFFGVDHLPAFHRSCSSSTVLEVLMKRTFSRHRLQHLASAACDVGRLVSLHVAAMQPSLLADPTTQRLQPAARCLIWILVCAGLAVDCVDLAWILRLFWVSMGKYRSDPSYKPIGALKPWQGAMWIISYWYGMEPISNVAFSRIMNTLGVACLLAALLWDDGAVQHLSTRNSLIAWACVLQLIHAVGVFLYLPGLGYYLLIIVKQVKLICLSALLVAPVLAAFQLVVGLAWTLVCGGGGCGDGGGDLTVFDSLEYLLGVRSFTVEFQQQLATMTNSTVAAAAAQRFASVAVSLKLMTAVLYCTIAIVMVNFLIGLMSKLVSDTHDHRETMRGLNLLHKSFIMHYRWGMLEMLVPTSWRRWQRVEQPAIVVQMLD